ncbi:MAG TPA: GNAT family N-acetyltransferase, partial [Roseiarcus sp.]
MRTFQISDFREHQDYGQIIADRVWNAWWKNAGLPLVDVQRHMTEMADERPLPMAVVAHSDHGYLGSAFLIHSDMEERPQYSPWIAAVWVEASERKRGFGHALIAEGAKIAGALGYRAA